MTNTLVANSPYAASKNPGNRRRTILIPEELHGGAIAQPKGGDIETALAAYRTPWRASPDELASYLKDMRGFA
jgi:hypothetical protein